MIYSVIFSSLEDLFSYLVNQLLMIDSHRSLRTNSACFDVYLLCIRFSRYRLRNFHSGRMAAFVILNGDGEIRTHDPLLARQVLSQLSYTPMTVLLQSSMGLSGLEPPTSRLSGARSNRLSYKPIDLAPTCFPMQSPA